MSASSKSHPARVAPPIIGGLDLFGISGKLILIEHDEEDCPIDLIWKAISGKVNIIFQPGVVQEFTKKDGASTTAMLAIGSISKIKKAISLLSNRKVDTFVINRIDLMDDKLNKRVRGSQMSAYLSMISSPRILLDANVIVTSVNAEHRIREIADKFISLRK